MYYDEEIARLREAREERRRKKRKRNIIITASVIVIIASLAVIIRIIAKQGDNGIEDLIVNAPDIEVSTHTDDEHAAEPEVETSLPTDEAAAVTEQPSQPPRRGTAEAIPESIRQSMAGKSMPAGATVTYDDLSYLTIPHYDFSYNVVEGHMVVNKAVAEEVLDIFAELYDIKYPIERMELIDKYNADDFTSIEYNNTSAFNYRVSTDGTGRLSKHALGRAIDINPQINPYVSGNGTGSHSNAREYWSRNYAAWTSDIARAAYIGPEADIYRIFVTEHGWEWGGSWSSYRDYQHFQKTR